MAKQVSLLGRLGFVKSPGAPVPHRKHTSACETVEMPVPATVSIVMSMHIGAPCTPVVKPKQQVYVGTLIGGLARFLVHYVVGATIWAEYMPEKFFGMSMHSPWFYSMLYNLAYMLPNIILCLIVFVLLSQPLKKYIRGEDIKQ